MTSKDAMFFNCSEKHEVEQVCRKYENPEAVRAFIKQKAAEGVIKYWTHDKLYAFLAENGFKAAPRPEKMTMAELAARIQEKCGISRSEAEKFVSVFGDCLEDALVAGESVTLTGFGTFKVVDQAARKGRNPQTGAEIDIPARKAVKFAPAKALKEAVANS